MDHNRFREPDSSKFKRN